MAGSKIFSGGSTASGGPISYASGSIVSGETRSLLTVFTETANATPSSGNLMYPLFSSSDLYFVVDSGTYAGAYYINRNTIEGETRWGNAYFGQLLSLGDLLNYQHWPPDNRLIVVVDNQSSDTHQVTIKYNTTNVFDTGVSTGLYEPFSGTPSFCASAPGGNAFDVGAVNTDWTIYFIIENKDQVNNSEVTITMTDFHGVLPSDYAKGGSINSGTSWLFNESSAWNYWRVPNIYISII